MAKAQRYAGGRRDRDVAKPIAAWIVGWRRKRSPRSGRSESRNLDWLWTRPDSADSGRSAGLARARRRPNSPSTGPSWRDRLRNLPESPPVCLACADDSSATPSVDSGPLARRRVDGDGVQGPGGKRSVFGVDANSSQPEGRVRTGAQGGGLDRCGSAAAPLRPGARRIHETHRVQHGDRPSLRG